MFLEASWPLQEKFLAGSTLVSDYSAGAAPVRQRWLNHLTEAMQRPLQAYWLQQCHSATVLNPQEYAASKEGDGLIAAEAAAVPVVLTADCLPILLAAEDGSQWAAVHAGWQGLHRGIIAAARKRFRSARLHAWIGPHICQEHYEVDADFRRRFLQLDARHEAAFKSNRPGHFLADLQAIARRQLQDAGMISISAAELCSFGDARFHSYRRDGAHKGNFASFILPRPKAL